MNQWYLQRLLPWSTCKQLGCSLFLVMRTCVGKCQFNVLIRLTLTQVGSDGLGSLQEFALLVAGTFQAYVFVCAFVCVRVCDGAYLRLFMHVNVLGASHEGKNTIIEAMTSSSRGFCVRLNLDLAIFML